MIDRTGAEEMRRSVIDLTIRTSADQRTADRDESGRHDPLFDDVRLVERSDEWELHLVLPVQRSGHAVGFRFILDADLSHDQELLAGFASEICFEADEVLRSKCWERNEVELIDGVYWLSDDDG